MEPVDGGKKLEKHPLDQVLSGLEVDPDEALSSNEAASRKSTYGPNVIKVGQRHPVGLPKVGMVRAYAVFWVLLLNAVKVLTARALKDIQKKRLQTLNNM